jgi:DNA-directed RNA polymerase delta subunit
VLDVKQSEFESEMVVVAVMIQKCVDVNSRVVQSQKEYRLRYQELVDRLEAAKKQNHSSIKERVKASLYYFYTTH